MMTRSLGAEESSKMDGNLKSCWSFNKILFKAVIVHAIKDDV